MAHEPVDGMLMVAQLKRRLLGGAVYTDVTIRRNDGDVRRLGTVLVLNDVDHAMVPGNRGRFYAYNVLGTKGIHGFRPVGRTAHGSFPQRFEVMLLSLGLLNLLLTVYFLSTGNGFAWISGATSLLGLTCGALFLRARTVAMRAYHQDDPNFTSKAEHRSARARAGA